MYSVLAALLIQVLLQITLLLDNKMAPWFVKQFVVLMEKVNANFFTQRKTKKMRALRAFISMHSLIISKFIILGAIYLAFGEQVKFSGPLSGVIAFIVVIIVMVGVESILKRLYFRLIAKISGDGTNSAPFSSTKFKHLTKEI